MPTSKCEGALRTDGAVLVLDSDPPLPVIAQLHRVHDHAEPVDNRQTDMGGPSQSGIRDKQHRAEPDIG